MPLDVSSSLRTEGVLTSFEAEADVTEASREDARLSFATVSGRMAGVGERVTLFGNVRAKADACCARCGKDFQAELDVPYEAVFARPAESSDDEGDPDLEFFEGSSVELDPSAAAALSLHMPMRFLCREDCEGICPDCGADLNESECSCQSTGEDSPFSALKALLQEEKEVDPRGGTER